MHDCLNLDSELLIHWLSILHPPTTYQLEAMVCLDEAELESLSMQLLQQLQGSEYECSSLTLLSGGSTNFVYRGTLATPCPTLAGNTVIVKHTKDFLAVGRTFEIDSSRCVRIWNSL